MKNQYDVDDVDLLQIRGHKKNNKIGKQKNQTK